MEEAPCIFRLTRNKDGRVSDFWVHGVNTGSWNVNLCRRLNDQEVEEMRNLLRIIDPFSLRPGREDRLVWDSSKSDKFNVKSCRDVKWFGMLSNGMASVLEA